MMNKPIRIEGDFAFIPLSKGYEAIIDLIDLPLVQGKKFYLSNTHRSFYAMRSDIVDGKNKTVYLHRLLMGSPVGFEIDHIDGNGLNNRRQNLRITTRAQNARNMRKHVDNKSGFKGVSWNSEKQKWEGRIHTKEKRVFLGYFESAEIAYKAYVMASENMHGEFGRID